MANPPDDSSDSSSADDSNAAPRSMRDFNYFAEDPRVQDIKKDQQDRARHLRRQRALWINGVLVVCVIAAVGYLFWGYQEQFAYHFNPKPLVTLGRAEEIAEPNFVHDRFVKISGLTEGRGAQMEWIRGVAPMQEYWYFHLLGSPVFIEVPASEAKGKIGPFQEVTVQGRMIDLRRAGEYRRLIAFFEGKLFMHLPERAYLVQVGVEPGHRLRYFVLFAVLLAIPTLSVLSWLRAYRRWRRDV